MSDLKRCRKDIFSSLTQNDLINHICKEYQEEMEQLVACGKAQPDEFVWTTKAEILFFYAMMGQRPVGINRHFIMLHIHNRFTSYINRDLSTKVLWDKLDTMYNMAVLNEREVCPFPEKDFELPEDCYHILEEKFGDPSVGLLSPRSKKKFLLGNPHIVNKPIKMVPAGYIIPREPKEQLILYKPEKVTDEPLIKETEVYVEKYNNCFVKKYTCSSENKHTGTVKKHADSYEKKYNDESVTFVSEKKDSDISEKKSEKELANKKEKMLSSGETLKKQSKASGNTMKKTDHGSIKKNNKILPVKHQKAEEHVKSGSSPQELEVPSCGSSRKSSPILKVTATLTNSMKKSAMVEETPKKTSVPKKRR